MAGNSPFRWSAIPAQHKKRLYQGVAAYAVVVLLAAGWVALKAPATRADWDARTPQASVDLGAAPAAAPAVPAADATPPAAAVAVAAASAPAAVTIAAAPAPAAPAPVAAKPAAFATPEIAIIVTDLGMSDSLTKQALALPAPVDLAISPYAPNIKDWFKKAEAAKHESLMLIPMEPAVYPQQDPGPAALLTRLSQQDNVNNLLEVLGRAQGYVGTMNYMGARFLADPKNLLPVFAKLREKNLFFVEDGGLGAPAGENTVSHDAVALTEISYLPADLRLDKIADGVEIEQQLTALEDLAAKKGYAIGVTQPYPVSFTVLKDWEQGLAAKGIKLVPVSALMKAVAAQAKDTPAVSVAPPAAATPSPAAPAAASPSPEQKQPADVQHSAP